MTGEILIFSYDMASFLGGGRRMTAIFKNKECQMDLIKTLVVAVGMGFSALVFAGPVNVNTASAEELAKELTGVGPAIAERIVAERKKAPFKSAQDLQQRVSGFGEKTAEKNKDNLKF
jgi:competence protein ComEA